jgi:hypothetical protein
MDTTYATMDTTYATMERRGVGDVAAQLSGKRLYAESSGLHGGGSVGVNVYVSPVSRS